MHKFIPVCQSAVIHIMTTSIKTITTVLKDSTDIITNITARPIGLAEILAIISVCLSVFKIVVILYITNANITYMTSLYKSTINIRSSICFAHLISQASPSS